MATKEHDEGLNVGSTAKPTRRGWSILAGAEARVLAITPSEVGFLKALGMTVGVIASINGVIVSVAASSWWSKPLVDVIWIMPIWTFVICLIDRLMFKSFGTNHWANAWLSVIRVAVTLAMALVFSGPMTQIIFQKSINAQLNKHIIALTHQATNSIQAVYDKKIVNAETDISSIHTRENQLASNAIADNFHRQCEVIEVGCSQSGHLGYGPYYYRDVAKAKKAQAESCTATKPVDEATIATLESNIAGWRSDITYQDKSRTQAIAGDRDYLARQTALNFIERLNPGVSNDVLFVFWFFVALDFVPLSSKLIRLFSSGAVYEKNAAALRHLDEIRGAHALNEQATVLQRRITEQARADEEVDRTGIEVDRDLRIAAEEAKADGIPYRDRAERINAFDLNSYIKDSTTHEGIAVRLSRNLTIGGWIGLGAAAGLAATLLAYSHLTHSPIRGEWIVVVAVMLATSLAAYTKGFRFAPPWAAKATFGTLLGGLALPLLILGINF